MQIVWDFKQCISKHKRNGWGEGGLVKASTINATSCNMWKTKHGSTFTVSLGNRNWATVNHFPWSDGACWQPWDQCRGRQNKTNWVQTVYFNCLFTIQVVIAVNVLRTILKYSQICHICSVNTSWASGNVHSRGHVYSLLCNWDYGGNNICVIQHAVSLGWMINEVWLWINIKVWDTHTPIPLRIAN